MNTPESKTKLGKRMSDHGRKNPSLWLVTIAAITASGLVMVYLLGRKFDWWGPLAPGEGPVVAGAFVVCAAALSYYSAERTRRHNRAELSHTEAKDGRDHRRQRHDSLRDRFLRATEQLASEKHATIRVAGVHSLAALANDWFDFGHDENGDPVQGATERQVCVDLLCTVLRTDMAPPGGNNEADLVGDRMVKNAVLGVISLNHGAWSAPVDNPVRLNLVGAKLSDLELAGKNLGRANLRNAVMERARLWGTDLRSANLTGAHLEGAELWSARLEKAILTRTKLQGASLTKAYLNDATLVEARLDGAVLKEAQLNGAFLHNARFDKASFRHASLVGSDLSKASLRRADLTGARLEGVDFSNAHLEGAQLRNAQIHGARFLNAHAQGSNFRDATLIGADFTGARFGYSTSENGIKYRTSLRGTIMKCDNKPIEDDLLELLSTLDFWDPNRRVFGDTKGITTDHVDLADYDQRTKWPEGVLLKGALKG